VAQLQLESGTAVRWRTGTDSHVRRRGARPRTIVGVGLLIWLAPRPSTTRAGPARERHVHGFRLVGPRGAMPRLGL